MEFIGLIKSRAMIFMIVICCSCASPSIHYNRDELKKDDITEDSFDLSASNTRKFWDSRQSNESTARFRSSDRRVIYENGKETMHEMDTPFTLILSCKNGGVQVFLNGQSLGKCNNQRNVEFGKFGEGELKILGISNSSTEVYSVVLNEESEGTPIGNPSNIDALLGEGQGDCDDSSECKEGLTCFNVAKNQPESFNSKVEGGETCEVVGESSGRSSSPGQNPSQGRNCPNNFGSMQDINFNINKLFSGVLVGHTDKNSTRIWAYPKNKKSIIVRYKKDGENICHEQAAQPRPDRRDTVLAELGSLAPGALYFYDIEIDGTTVTSGKFETAPDVNQDQYTKFNFAFGSCTRTNGGNADFEQRAFIKMKELDPKILLLLGDNVYAHSVNRRTRLDHNHVPQRGGVRNEKSVKYFWPMIKQVPTYAVWDDHDFGGNNSKSNDLKLDNDPDATPKESRDSFMDAWANPSYGERNQGVYHSFKWGNVEFFMLDGRYFKTSSVGLGNMQLEWLKNKLRSSTATFKILAHGQTLPGSNSGGEAWHRPDVEEVVKLANDENINGLVWLGGDVHHNRFSNHEKRNIDKLQLDSYDGLFEVVSSGVGSKGQGTWVMVDVDTTYDKRSEHQLKFSFYKWDNPHNPRDASLSVSSSEKANAVEIIYGRNLGWQD